MPKHFISPVSGAGIGGGPLPGCILSDLFGFGTDFHIPLGDGLGPIVSADWNPLPADLIFEGISIRGFSGDGSDVAPQDTQVKMFLGLPSDTNPAGSAVILPQGQKIVSGATSVTVPHPATVSDVAATAFGWNIKQLGGGDPFATQAAISTKYRAASPFQKWNVLGCLSDGFDDPGEENYPIIMGAHVGGLGGDDERTLASAIGIPGTFKYLLVVLNGGTQNDMNITVGLRVNGSTVISVTTPNNANVILLKEQATAFHVLATDRVCFIADTDNHGVGGPDHHTEVHVAIGFLPD